MFKTKTTQNKINSLKLDKAELEKQLEILWCFQTMEFSKKYQERIIFAEKKLARLKENLRQLEIQLIEEQKNGYKSV
jgi:hypothetical protein